MKEGFAAGSANIENLDEGAINFPIIQKNQETELKKILSNSFGFGGTNATLIFEKDLERNIIISYATIRDILRPHVLIHIIVGVILRPSSPTI